MSSANPLARLESAVTDLDAYRTIDEVKELRDKAEVARLYARERDLGLEAQNYAAEIKIRAERKLGELLVEMPKHPGGLSDHSTPPPAKLADLGISRDQSSQWQQIAEIDEEEFEREIAEAKAEERPLTTAGIVRLARPSAFTNLPPTGPTRAERAYTMLGPLLAWIDTDPAEVAATCAQEDLEDKVLVVGGLSAWINAVHDAMTDRLQEPFSVMRGGRTA